MLYKDLQDCVLISQLEDWYTSYKMWEHVIIFCGCREVQCGLLLRFAFTSLKYKYNKQKRSCTLSQFCMSLLYVVIQKEPLVKFTGQRTHISKEHQSVLGQWSTDSNPGCLDSGMPTYFQVLQENCYCCLYNLDHSMDCYRPNIASISEPVECQWNKLHLHFIWTCLLKFWTTAHNLHTFQLYCFAMEAVKCLLQ